MAICERIGHNIYTPEDQLPDEADCPECKIERLTAENSRMREALEQLAILGNEPYPGNSDGNVIAQRALAAVSSQQEPKSDG